MANIKISQLPSLATLADTTVFSTVDSGVNYKSSALSIKNYITWPVTNTTGSNGPTNIAIGQNAGATGIGNVAIGVGAAGTGNNIITIGTNAGQGYTGNGSILIGPTGSVSANSLIVFNATGSTLTPVSAQRDSFYVAPIRNNAGTSGVLQYNSTTKEVTYGNAITIGSKTWTFGTDGALTAPGRINLGTTDNIGYESFTNSNLIPYLGSKRKLSGLLKQEYANSNFTNLISTKIVDGVFSINEPSNTTTKSVRYTGYIKNPGLASQDFSFTIENPTAGDDDVTISITTEGWYVDSLGAILGPGSRINTTVWGDIPGGQVQGPVTQSWGDLSADTQVEMVKVTIELKNVPALGQFNISWSSESGSSSNNFSGLAFTNLTNLVESIASDADIRVLSGSNTWKFGTDGSLTLPSAGKIVNNNKEWLFNDTDGTLSSKMFLANAGSYGTTGYSFTGDGGLDTGMFSAGDGQIQFYSNTVKVAEIASGNLTISGHPTIEGVTSTGATGTGKLVFDNAPTFSGHITVEGVTSTGATGTGKLVFDNAPTFSGAVTVSNGDQSTSSTTGALIIAGGVGITRNLYVDGVVSTPVLLAKDVRDTVYAATFASTFTPDAANGAIQNLTLTGSITINAFASPQTGQTVTLILTQGGTGSYTLTSSMKFAGGLKTLSTAVGSVDLLTITYTGSVYYASLVTGFV